MVAIAGGLGAALAWALGTTCATRSSRTIGPVCTVAWVMLTGLLVLIAPLAAAPLPSIDARTAVWLVGSGVGNVGGLLLLYRALRIGNVGVVAPIAAAEGGVTAVIAILAGQAVALDRGIALACVVVGVILTARVRQAAAATPEHGSPGDPRAALWAGAAALSFGAGLYGTGRAGVVLPLAWAILPPRLVGVLVITLPLAARRSLRLTRPAAPLVAAAGCCEVTGFAFYALGARHGLATTAVMASLTGAIAAAFGRLVFGERLRAIQIVGVAAIFAGVATLSVISV
jgi:drug/metabolite transporter (DMT)-like permease